MLDALDPMFAVQDFVKTLCRLGSHIHGQFCTSLLLLDHNGRSCTGQSKEPVEVFAVANGYTCVQDISMSTDLRLIKGNKNAKKDGGSKGVETCLGGHVHGTTKKKKRGEKRN